MSLTGGAPSSRSSLDDVFEGMTGIASTITPTPASLWEDDRWICQVDSIEEVYDRLEDGCTERILTAHAGVPIPGRGGSAVVVCTGDQITGGDALKAGQARKLLAATVQVRLWL
jgi:hypothetical protein